MESLVYFYITLDNNLSFDHHHGFSQELSRTVIHKHLFFQPIRPSIHPPLIRSLLPEDFLFPGHISQLWLGNPEGLSGHCRDMTSPPGPRSALGPPLSWTYQEHLPWETIRRHPYQMPGPPQLAPQCKDAAALLTYCRKPKHSSHFGYTEIGWPWEVTLLPHTSAAPPLYLQRNPLISPL